MKKIQIDKESVYCRLFCKAVREAAETQNEVAIDRMVLFGVRFLLSLEEPKEADDVCRQYYLFSAVMRAIEAMEPSRFVRIFPIEKTYDGHRYQTKDYFTTVKMIEENGWNIKIPNAFEFLWDYQNWDISIFLVNYMSIISSLRRVQGKPGLAEEWCMENGIPIYRIYTDENGKQFMVDKEGRTFAVKKPKPKHLKLVRLR
ncbi:hypothetical protein AAC03nite_20630 [Alicyclobacillus acidoterrestris]|nr:hypothetical protein AAC03nite_20630 [Alicyclobacillus acidoterrestris]